MTISTRSHTCWPGVASVPPPKDMPSTPTAHASHLEVRRARGHVVVGQHADGRADAGGQEAAAGLVVERQQQPEATSADVRARLIQRQVHVARVLHGCAGVA